MNQRGAFGDAASSVSPRHNEYLGQQVSLPNPRYTALFGVQPALHVKMYPIITSRETTRNSTVNPPPP